MQFRIGQGIDSHRFLKNYGKKKCVIGGQVFDDIEGLDADSDGDVVYHAFCHAVSSIVQVSILGSIAPEICKKGKTDSKHYVLEAKKLLKEYQIESLSFALEGKKPRMESHFKEMRKNLAQLLEIDEKIIGFTCTTGDGLTSFGRGEGLYCMCQLLVNIKNESSI